MRAIAVSCSWLVNLLLFSLLSTKFSDCHATFSTTHGNIPLVEANKQQKSITNDDENASIINPRIHSLQIMATLNPEHMHLYDVKIAFAKSRPDLEHLNNLPDLVQVVSSSLSQELHMLLMETLGTPSRISKQMDTLKWEEEMILKDPSYFHPREKRSLTPKCSVNSNKNEMSHDGSKSSKSTTCIVGYAFSQIEFELSSTFTTYPLSHLDAKTRDNYIKGDRHGRTKAVDGTTADIRVVILIPENKTNNDGEDESRSKDVPSVGEMVLKRLVDRTQIILSTYNDDNFRFIIEEMDFDDIHTDEGESLKKEVKTKDNLGFYLNKNAECEDDDPSRSGSDLREAVPKPEKEVHDEL